MDVIDFLLDSWDRQCRIVESVSSLVQEENRHLKPSPDGWPLDHHLAHMHKVRHSIPVECRSCPCGFDRRFLCRWLGHPYPRFTENKVSARGQRPWSSASGGSGASRRHRKIWLVRQPGAVPPTHGLARRVARGLNFSCPAPWWARTTASLGRDPRLGSVADRGVLTGLGCRHNCARGA